MKNTALVFFCASSVAHGANKCHNDRQKNVQKKETCCTQSLFAYCRTLEDVCVCVCGCMCVITHTLSPPLLAACTCGEWWVSYLRKAAFLKQLLDIQFLRILDPLDKLEETARYAMSGEGGKCTWPHPFCLPTPDSLHFSSSSDVTLLPTLQDWRFRTQIRHFYN